MSGIVVGFSGGVDSCVAARLLMREHEVFPLFLDNGVGNGAQEAREAAEALGLSLRVLDISDVLEERVCRPFSESYRRGETPNPCVICNPTVKFRSLCAYADELGLRQVATGHYARAEGGALYKGRAENDQSYMLCRLTREQVSRLVLPLGGMNKAEVRALAADFGLPVAEKPASMDICFIPQGGHAEWMAARGEAPPEGDIIYKGKAVARHGGIHRFTLGQRRGLGFAAGQRVYVSEIRPETNEVVLEDGDGLFATRILAREMNWLIDEPREPFSCTARVRHSREEHAATARALPGGGLELCFEAPVRAPTRGQSAVLYQGEKLLGGGYI